MKPKTSFKLGDTVSLRPDVKPRSRETRTIQSFYPDIPGGVRLSAPLNGFVSWNVQDLMPSADSTD